MAEFFSVSEELGGGECFVRRGGFFLMFLRFASGGLVGMRGIGGVGGCLEEEEGGGDVGCWCGWMWGGVGEV